MKSVGILPALCLAMISVPAMGAALIIDDRLDTIVVNLNDFEEGFSINGNLVQQGLGSPVAVLLDETAPFTFEGQWVLGGPITVESQTIYFVEPNDPTVVSDILTFTYDSPNGFGHIKGSFQSDTEGNLGPLPPGAKTIVENGLPFDFSNTNITANAVSDAVEAIPLPAAAWGGIVLLGLIGGHRLVRRR